MDAGTFLTELHIRAYITQIAGLPLGNPERRKFRPVVTVTYLKGNKIDRQATLAEPQFESFTEAERKLPLDES